MKGEQYTLKDLARALNLSVSTVSRALSDHPDVNKETKKRVQEFAKAVEFQKNPLALSLLKHKTNAIGVIIPEIANYFFSRVISGVQKIAYQAGYNVLICVSEESIETEMAIIKHLVNSRVDGLLVAVSAGTNKYDHFEFITRKNIPLILFDRVSEKVQASTIITNNFEASFQAVEYLIKTGCKKIVHIAGPEHLSITQERLEGYEKALKKYQLPLESKLVRFAGFSEIAGREAIKNILESGVDVDAVFAVNDRTAIGAMLWLKSQNIDIPNQVSIIGFNNNPMGEVTEPTLSTVIQPQLEMGELCAELLIEQMDSQKEDYPLKHLVLPSRLLIRESTKK